MPPKIKTLITFSSAVFAILAFMIICQCSKEQIDPQYAEAAIKTFKNLLDQGTVTADAVNFTVYVNPIIWELLDAKAKRGLAESGAIYCAHKRSDKKIRIDICDMQSGKKLAHYNSSKFEVY